MKKIIISSSLVVFMVSANAQLVSEVGDEGDTSGTTTTTTTTITTTNNVPKIIPENKSAKMKSEAPVLPAKISSVLNLENKTIEIKKETPIVPQQIATELIPEDKIVEIGVETFTAHEPPVEKELSEAERMRIYRSKLENRNLVLLERKIEEIRMQQELALAKKLEQSMNQTISAIGKL
jgi:hypothetical protein